MFITDASYDRSLAICRAIEQSPTGNFDRVCREGVFMQIYQPLEPDDFDLVELLPEKPDQNNYRRLCVRFGPEDEGACLREAWPLFKDDLMSGVGVKSFCTGQPNIKEEDACYDSVLAIIGRGSLSKPDDAAQACSVVPEKQRGKCFASVASAYIEENRLDMQQAVDFCYRADGNAQGTCLETLARRARFTFGSGQADVF